jgi:hypothetical protein
MAHSLKRQIAKKLLNYLRLSGVVLKLYPVAIENSFPSITRERIDELRNLLQLNFYRDVKLMRFGSLGDGGYLISSDLTATDYCISLGVGDNYTFDLAIAEKLEEVWMFDHTVVDPKISNNKIKFNKIGISSTSSLHFTTIPEILVNIPLESEVILKIDIEGSEWDVLSQIPSSDIQRFKQIVAEFHHLHNIADDNFFSVVSKALTSLNKSHSLVNLHVNNWSDLHFIQGIPFPDVIEVTYIRRQSNDQLKPFEMQNSKDSSNNFDIPDFASNFINFLRIN